MIDKISAEVGTAADECAGNWRRFDSFGWHDRPIDADAWAIFYTGGGRDASLLAASNHAAIVASLQKADPRGACWREESHGHWAVGHIDAIVIRPRTKRGKVSAAFRALHACAMALADYPCLDDSDYSQRQYDAQHDAIESACQRFASAAATARFAPGEVASAVWRHLADVECALEDADGYVDESDVRDALAALGWLAAENAADVDLTFQEAQ